MGDLAVSREFGLAVLWERARGRQSVEFFYAWENCYLSVNGPVVQPVSASPTEREG